VSAARSPFWKALLSFLAISLSTADAEDWTTTDGTVYQNVRIIKVEADGITILYENGGLMIPLNKLPPDLQKRFSYDPAVAKAAAKIRADQEKASAKALQKEIEQADVLKRKDQIAQAQALAQAHAEAAGLAPAKTNAPPAH
jgi:BMFP domain-containing protein YqiC